jgi:hypothetical protein
MWQSFDEGRTIGESGSEKGVILLDEEHVDGARITLERDGYTPFAITCGIYGWMAHTRFFANEEEARQTYGEMKHSLESIVQSIPLTNEPDFDARIKATTRMIADFVEHYP